MSCLAGAECSGPWERRERRSGGGAKKDKTSHRVWVWNNSYVAGISQEAPDSTDTITDPAFQGGKKYWSLTATAWIKAALWCHLFSIKGSPYMGKETMLKDEPYVSQWQYVWHSDVTCGVRRTAKTVNSIFFPGCRGLIEREVWMTFILVEMRESSGCEWLGNKLGIKAEEFWEWGREWMERDAEGKQAEIDKCEKA